jgi:GT2 family glycosyltransferase
MKLSIIIINFNTEVMTLDCLQSIKNNPIDAEYEIIVVDNGSVDNSVVNIRKFHPDVNLIESNINLGFSRANNIGIKESKGDFILLLNSDTLVHKGSLEGLVTLAEETHGNVSVAPKLLNADGTWQRSNFKFPSAVKIFIHSMGLTILAKLIVKNKLLSGFSYFGKYNFINDLDFNGTISVDYVLFACVMFPRRVVDQIGLLDENMFFYHEDCDYGYRLFLNNIPQLITDRSCITHYGGGSSRQFSKSSYLSYYKGLLYFFKKNYGFSSYISLRILFLMAFFWRAVMTIFGYYAVLKTPTTYSTSIDFSHCPPFDSVANRILFYIKIVFIKCI